MTEQPDNGLEQARAARQRAEARYREVRLQRPEVEEVAQNAKDVRRRNSVAQAVADAIGVWKSAS